MEHGDYFMPIFRDEQYFGRWDNVSEICRRNALFEQLMGQFEEAFESRVHAILLESA